MAKNDGTFGFEDLQKAFNRIEQKYEKQDGRYAYGNGKCRKTACTCQDTDRKNKKAERFMATKKPKTFGKARVARVQTEIDTVMWLRMDIKL